MRKLLLCFPAWHTAAFRILRTSAADIACRQADSADWKEDMLSLPHYRCDPADNGSTESHSQWMPLRQQKSYTEKALAGYGDGNTRSAWNVPAHAPACSGKDNRV